MKKLLRLPSVCMAIVVFVSCEKKDVVPPSTSEGSTLDKIVYLSPDGADADTAFYLYDGENRLSQIVHHSITNTDDEKEAFEYNTEGKFTGYTHSYTNMLGQPVSYRANFSYNQNGNISEGVFSSLAANGFVNAVYTYAYDNKGNLIADTLHYQPGVVYSYNRYTYDADGNLTQNDFYTRDTSTSTGFSFAYSTLVVSDDHINAFHDIGRQLFLASNPDNVLYLTKGNVSRESVPDGSFPSVTTYSYYNNNLPKASRFNNIPTLNYFFK